MKKNRYQNMLFFIVIIVLFLEIFSNVTNSNETESKIVYHTCIIPDDPYFDNQWALDNINAPNAWNLEKGDKDIVVAIIDTGIDYNHPDLAENIWTNIDEIPNNGLDDDGNGYIDDIRGWDFVNNDSDPRDDCGHGTHCSGIISAVTDNGIGIAGVCWNCAIMPLKGFDESGCGYDDDLINAIFYAIDNGADIISMSWGSSSFSDLLNDTLNYAYSQDIVLIAAAGNDNTDSKYYPAGYDTVIGVAATDENDCKASFSNYGSWIDVSAPGVNILSTFPDNGYESRSGTSMACPHIAGLVALILSKNPDFTPIEIQTILRSTMDIGIDAFKTMLKGRIFYIINQILNMCRLMKDRLISKFTFSL